MATRPDTGSSWTSRWLGIGLRARVTFLFGLGALLLSASMGGLSYFSARHFLVSERESAALHEAYGNAVLVRSALHLGTKGYDQLLASLDSVAGTHSVLLVHTRPYASPLDATSSVPGGLRALVESGTPAVQNVSLGGSPEIVVGIPIPSVSAAYFEIFDVSDLAHTLTVLALALAAAGLVTTMLGAALGRSASVRSLRPLTGVSRAAVAIAGGQLDTRLPAVTDDPDLAGLTRSFNAMVDQLQERIEREERFSSDVSHELRSPLTTLSATLDVLEAHEEELSPRSRAALMLLGADLRRFQRMVSDLLEISRTDTGSADVSPEVVQAGELVTRSVSSSMRTVPPGVEAPLVEVDEAVTNTQLSVDKRRFERVMVNLLENAALYGGGATRVAAEPGPIRADGRGTIWVSVEDNGPGLEPAERTRVFERFYRGQVSGRRGTSTGTGLGLSLVAEHVRLNGGRVWAEAAPSGGARFVVELPIEDDLPA
jgi:two-component system sensor histidine kinase MtrB